MFILDPGFGFFVIPDPVVKIAPEAGSGSVTLVGRGILRFEPKMKFFKFHSYLMLEKVPLGEDISKNSLSTR